MSLSVHIWTLGAYITESELTTWDATLVRSKQCQLHGIQIGTKSRRQSEGTAGDVEAAPSSGLGASGTTKSHNASLETPTHVSTLRILPRRKDQTDRRGMARLEAPLPQADLPL